MNIVFVKSKLSKLFNDERALKCTYGERQTKLIMQRMAELHAVDNLDIMRSFPRARCHELKGDLKGQISVDLVHPYRLIFKPNHEPVPELDSGGLDWKKVTKINILGIEDTHE